MIAIKAAWVIVSADDVRERAAVLIDGARVADVVPWEQIPAGISIVDRSRAIVHPGFVNAHEHQYGLLSHGIPQVGEVVDFDSFLRAYWWPAIEDRIRKQQVLITSRASMADSGSSRSRTFGSVTIARASAARCCWPPDSSAG